MSPTNLQQKASSPPCGVVKQSSMRRPGSSHSTHHGAGKLSQRKKLPQRKNSKSNLSTVHKNTSHNPNSLNSQAPKHNARPNEHFISAKHLCKIATFNCRKASKSRLELMAKTFLPQNIHICGLTETHTPGEGSRLIFPPNAKGNISKAFTYLWSGCKKREIFGVGLLLSPHAHHALIDWKAISPRIIKARFKTPHARMTIICTYCPTTTYPDSKQEAHYRRLSELVAAVPQHDLLAIVGDFNAHLGNDRTGISRELGPFSNPAPQNSLGTRVIDFCQQHNLFITNTFFEHKPTHRDTYRGDNNEYNHLLDLILVRQRFRTSVLDTRVSRKLREYVPSDHELVICKIRIKLRTRPHHKPPRLDTECLINEKKTRRSYMSDLRDQLPDPKQLPDSDPETLWSSFKDGILKAAKNTLPPVKKRVKHWMTEDLLALVEKKATAFAKFRDTSSNHPQYATFKEEYRKLKNQCKIDTRAARENAWTEEAEALETHLNKHNSRAAFDSLKKFVKPKQSPTDNIKTKDGKFITEVNGKLERWKEHYGDLLSSEQKINESVFNTISPVQIPDDEPPPTVKEVEEAVERLKNRKATGVCEIPAELLKYGGKRVTEFLHAIITKVWETEVCPQDWKDAILVNIFKKGDAAVCNNYRGISLLSIPGKVFALILLNRVSARMEATVMEHQAGFRRNRGTPDQMFTLNQILSNSYDYNKTTHTCFIDLKKAYDTVNRPALWKVLTQTGLSKKVQRLLNILHSNTRAFIRAYGKLSTPLHVKNGVRQGCVLAPALFNIFLDHIIRTALKNSTDGVTIRYTLDGVVRKRYRVKREEEIEELVQILLYADDMAIVCDCEKGLVKLVKKLDEVTQAWCLDISQEKTKILTVTRTKNAPPINISLRNEDLENVEKFKYLGRTFTNTPDLTPEITTRIQKASSNFYKYAGPLYRRKDISLKNKIHVLRTTAIPTLLYGSETWAPTKEHIRRLEVTQHQWIRYCLGIRFETHGHISNSKLRKKCKLPKIETLIRRNRLRWIGHLVRMPDSRLPKKALCSRLDGKRPPGGCRMSWSQIVEKDIAELERVTGKPWMQVAKNRKRWRKLIHEPHRLPVQGIRRSSRIRAERLRRLEKK